VNMGTNYGRGPDIPHINDVLLQVRKGEDMRKVPHCIRLVSNPRPARFISQTTERISIKFGTGCLH
jgi:hypothetical protein